VARSAAGEDNGKARWIGPSAEEVAAEAPAVVVPFPPEVASKAVRAPDTRCDATWSCELLEFVWKKPRPDLPGPASCSRRCRASSRALTQT